MHCNICAVKDANKDRMAILKLAARKLRGLAKGYESEADSEPDSTTAIGVSGRIEGLEQAADIVEGGRF